MGGETREKERKKLKERRGHEKRVKKSKYERNET